MKIVKSALACAAAVGLLASHAAAAAVPGGRAGAAIGQREGLGTLEEGSAPVIAIISLLALVAVVVLVTDDDDEEPASP